MEQTFSMAWPEVGYLSKGALGHFYTGTSVGCADGLPHMSHELNKSSMTASSMANNLVGPCGPQVPSLQEGFDYLQHNGVNAYADDVVLHASSSATVPIPAPGLQMNSSGSLIANLFISPRFGIVNSEIPGPVNALCSSRTTTTSKDASFCQQQCPSTSQSRVTWCQSYPLDIDKGKINDSGLGNIWQNEIHAREGSLRGPEAGPAAQIGQSASQQQVQGGTRGLMPMYGTHSGLAPPQDAAATSRPRVRARRGQATDPHSIAERLRRERIAERMKALQELVPNFNKTDKASMLDEIIEYVKFLQLQVKVLSMSRLGVGAVAPLIADVPLEDGLAAAERQVTMLMEEDMGSAMQFLQSKGLCLMPVSLASAISRAHARSMTDHSSTVAGSSSSLASAATSVSAGRDGDSLSL